MIFINPGKSVTIKEFKDNIKQLRNYRHLKSHYQP